MPAIKFDLTKADRILWPQECAVCGDPAQYSAKASCSIAKDLRYRVVYLGWTKHRISIEYPICRKHRIFAAVMGILGQRNLVNLGIGFLFAFFFLFGVGLPLVAWIASGIPLQGSPRAMIISSIIFFVGFALFLWIHKSVPVKLSDVTDDAIRLRIARDEFASEFLRMNHPAATKV